MFSYLVGSESQEVCCNRDKVIGVAEVDLKNRLLDSIRIARRFSLDKIFFFTPCTGPLSRSALLQMKLV